MKVIKLFFMPGRGSNRELRKARCLECGEPYTLVGATLFDAVTFTCDPCEMGKLGHLSPNSKDLKTWVEELRCEIEKK